MFGGVQTTKYKELWEACEKEYYTHARNTIASGLYTEKRKKDNGPAIRLDTTNNVQTAAPSGMVVPDGFIVDNNLPNYEYCVSSVLNPEWPFNALYIDTIGYNSFVNEMEELEELRVQYSKLPDKVPEPDSKEPKRENGEEYKPYCEKYFPLNYAKIFGIDDLLPIPFMNVSELLFHPDGKPKMKTKFVLKFYDKAGSLVNESDYEADETEEQNEDINSFNEKYPGGKVKITTEQKQETEKHNVALIDGYAYVPTGIKIKLEYTRNSNV